MKGLDSEGNIACGEFFSNGGHSIVSTSVREVASEVSNIYNTLSWLSDLMWSRTHNARAVPEIIIASSKCALFKTCITS